METFSAILAICAGNSPVIAEYPAQRPVKRSFDVFLDLRLNKRLSNNRDAGDLRRHRAHYDVTVMGDYSFGTQTTWPATSQIIVIITHPRPIIQKTKICYHDTLTNTFLSNISKK